MDTKQCNNTTFLFHCWQTNLMEECCNVTYNTYLARRLGQLTCLLITNLCCTGQWALLHTGKSILNLFQCCGLLAFNSCLIQVGACSQMAQLCSLLFAQVLHFTNCMNWILAMHKHSCLKKYSRKQQCGNIAWQQCSEHYHCKSTPNTVELQHCTQHGPKEENSTPNLWCLF